MDKSTKMSKQIDKQDKQSTWGQAEVTTFIFLFPYYDKNGQNWASSHLS